MSSRWKPRFVLAFLIAASAVSAPPAQASFPGLPGDIVFQRSRPSGPVNADIYTAVPGQLSATNITNNPAIDENPKWSPDGTKILFDSGRDGNYEIYTMNPDGTGVTRITNNSSFDWQPAWSPDGTKIVFSSGRDGDPKGEIYTMNADGTGVTRLTNDPNRDWNPSWSPGGTKIAWNSDRAVDVFGDHQWDIYTMNADGTGQTRLTTDPDIDANPNWSPDGTKIAFATRRAGAQFDIWWMNADGTGQQIRVPTTSVDEVAPAFQPDSPGGTGGIIFARSVPPPVPNEPGGGSDIYKYPPTTRYSSGSDAGAVDESPDWQPIPFTGYPRPKGATPLRVSLVPAFKQCASPNRTHGSPLAFPSCNPPSQASNFLTVGTPDANGAGANSTGYMRLDVIPHQCCPPQDLRITGTITDVRCRGATSGCGGANTTGGPDYTGELQMNTTIRITDHNNGPNVDEPATVTDIPFPVNMQCVGTADPSVGGSCSVYSDAVAVVPEASTPPRAVVQIGQLAVFDGGPDGQVSTNDNTLFEVQGVFVP
jgi:TolB protein